MKILEFTTEQNGIDLLETCSSNSNLSNNISSSITYLLEHTTNGKKWCYRENLENINVCAGNESLNTAEINQYISDSKCIELEKTNQELIDEGYLEDYSQYI